MLNTKTLSIAMILLVIVGIIGYVYINREDKVTIENNLETNKEELIEQNESTVVDVVVSDEMQSNINDEIMPQQGLEDDSTIVSEMLNPDSEVNVYVITANDFTFSPTRIEASEGDLIRLVLDNKAGTHDIVIDEFNVSSRITNSGQRTEVEFIADKKGAFEFYCSVGNHRQMGMVGTLVVN